MRDLDYENAVHAALAVATERAANRTPEERVAKNARLAMAQASARKFYHELTRRQGETDIVTEERRYRGSAA